MEQVGLEIGDQIYLAKHDSLPGAVVLLPIELMAQWILEGRRSMAKSNEVLDNPAGGSGQE